MGRRYDLDFFDTVLVTVWVLFGAGIVALGVWSAFPVCKCDAAARIVNANAFSLQCVTSFCQSI
jgi:hypothetical protein